MKHFFKPTTFKLIIIVAFIAMHVGGNLLYNRSLNDAGGKLSTDAGLATIILYYVPNAIVAPLQPLKSLFRAMEKNVQIPFAFALYTIIYLLYLYTVSCGIALPIEKFKKGRPGPTR